MWLLVLALATTGIAFVTFVVTTLVSEPASIITLGVILLLSVILAFGWTGQGAAGSAAKTAGAV
jgi:hypothetical protein